MIQPKAAIEKKKLEIHGIERIDNYYWLNNRDDKKVLDYLNKENEYTDHILKDTESFQEDLYNEIISRIKQDDQSVPYFKNGYFYFTRFEKGKDYPIYCRKKESLDAPEEILLNVNLMANDNEYFNVVGLSISENNEWLTYGVDNVGRRIYTIYIKNLSTGEVLDETVEHTSGNSCWANDNKTIFFSRKDEVTLRSDKILKHTYFENQEDKIVFEEDDTTFGTGVYKTKSGKFIIIVSYHTHSDEYRILDANQPNGEFRIFHPREKNLEYSIYHYDDRFYIRTNYNAENFRIMVTNENKTTLENWQEVLPYNPEILNEGISIFKNHLVITERIEGLQQLKIINLKNNTSHFISFDEEAYSVALSANPEFDTPVLRFVYSSMATPFTTFDYNMDTKERTQLKQQVVLGDFNSNNYTTERFFVTSHDNEKIPISLVHRKDISLYNNNPVLLYGYGSYGHTIDPSFSSVRLSLLDRGFIFVYAHIRGSEIKGRQWYEKGKLLKKKNTFYDFISCARFLIDKNITSRDKLFIKGGSAGGLLMGAVVNMAPELFKGVIASVPFVDVVTTMLDDSIPLTTGEYDEWGNPNDKEYFEYMLSYSPYDNIEHKDYPNMLVITGYHDSQVQYWEPAKWVAKLREYKTDNNLLLFNINMDAGHSGASGRFKQYRETVLEYAFVFKLLNQIPKKVTP